MNNVRDTEEIEPRQKTGRMNSIATRRVVWIVVIIAFAMCVCGIAFVQKVGLEQDVGGERFEKVLFTVCQDIGADVLQKNAHGFFAPPHSFIGRVKLFITSIFSQDAEYGIGENANKAYYYVVRDDEHAIVQMTTTHKHKATLISCTVVADEKGDLGRGLYSELSRLGDNVRLLHRSGSFDLDSEVE